MYGLLKNKTNDIMLTKENAINVAKAFVEACKNKGIAIEKAILFGSVAKDRQHEYSDIDTP